MADIESKHSVSQIPAGEALPEPYKRSVGVETSGIPNYQAALSNYAASTNWMSAIGSAVASKASQAMASKLGNDLGKNPKGDLSLPPITDFDKAFAQSYQAQAQVSLGLQANKLISEANIQMAQAPKMTPELISATNHQISIGLKNIFQNAPSEIRPQLEYQYNSIQVNQTENAMMRMLKEQKEDRQNNLVQFSKVTNQNLYSMGFNGSDLDKNGDSKAALSSLASIDKSYQSAVDMRDLRPQDKQVAIDSARKSYLSGKYSRLGLEAYKNGKLDEYLASLVDHPPKDISLADHDAVFQNVTSFLSHEVSLKSHQENIVAQEMDNRIATDPTKITGQDWSQFESQVSPFKALQTKFKLIQALKANTTKSLEIDSLATKWSNPTAQALASPELKNSTFVHLVNFKKENNPNLSDDDAIVQVGKSAGGVIPAITNIVHNKLISGNPAELESGVKIVRQFQELKAGHALEGISDADKALVASYETLRNPQDPKQAAQFVIDNAQNMDEPVLKLTNQKWDNLVYTNTKASGATADQWILKKFGFKGVNWFGRQNRFDSGYNETLYAADIYGKYRSFYQLVRGDDSIATKLTQEYVDANYGLTYVNGERQWTLNPIEKTIGFNSGDGIPMIYKDVVRQFKEPLANLKEAYDKKASDHYWTIEETTENLTKQDLLELNPENAGKSGLEILSASMNQPEKITPKPYLIMTKHTRAALGTKVEKFPVVFTGTNFDQWDVNVKSANGPFSLMLAAPELGLASYKPDRSWIINEYMGNYQSFPKEKVAGILKDFLDPKSDEQILESFNSGAK
jgi:hypothetical protein